MALIVWRWLFVGVFIFTTSLPLLAQDDPEDENEEEYGQLIQEFFFTEAVYPQEKNELQFTASDYSRGYHDLQILIEYGITDRLQVELELSDLMGQGVTESVAGEFGILYNAINKGSFSLSVASEIGMAEELNEELIKEREVEWEQKVIFSKQLGHLQLHTDIGMEVSEDTEWNFNTGLIIPVKDWKGIVELNKVNEGSAEWNVTPGIIWNGFKKTEFAFGVPIDLSSDSNRTGFVARFTIEFWGDD